MGIRISIWYQKLSIPKGLLQPPSTATRVATLWQCPLAIITTNKVDDSCLTSTIILMVEDKDSSFRSLGHNDLPTLLGSYQLHGCNYLQWASLVHSILKEHNKLSHIEGNSPAQTDPMFEAWDIEVTITSVLYCVG
ncbi:hypothetical protein CR513_22405, partial [Mucuna pruriens]